MNKNMRILIGYDGSPSSLFILDDLSRAGLPKHVDVFVLTAADYVLPGLIDIAVRSHGALINDIEKAHRVAMEEAEKVAAGAANCFRTKFPSWNVQHAISPESPAWAIA